MKKALIAVVGLALAAAGLAQLSKYKDWGKSAEAYFLTSEEKQAWSRVASDEEAEKFIATYWSKRDPNPATTANEFRDEINRRIAAADEQFKVRSKRGSETNRGRLLVVLGLPSRVSTQRAQEQSAIDDTGGVTAPSIDTRPTSFDGSPAVVQTWTYAKDKFDPSLGIGELRVRINVDPQRGTDDVIGAGAVDKAVAKIAEESIVSTGAAAVPPAVPPAATGPATAAAPPGASAPPAPVPAQGARAAAPAASPAAPAPASAALPAAVRSALEGLAKDKAEGSFWGGEFHAISGEPFYALQFYLSAEKAAEPLKFAGIVWNDSNQAVGTYWDDATPIDVKSGARMDKVFDRSIALPPGSYRGSFGLFTASGTPVATSGATFKLEAPASSFGVSPLILANTLTPLTKRPEPTDPFVFGMEKPIKVEPKGDRKFAKDDSLWYFYAVSNPILPAAAAAAPAAPAAPATTPGATTTPAEASEPKPRVMTRITVLRDGQNAFQPLTGLADLQELAPGYYASGSEIPLVTFEPGYYTFAVQVRDLNAPRDSAASKGIERKEDFVVLNADGTLPPRAKKPEAKPKAPAKKP
ncbi:MAG TPA: GWxTD domain-containing protein [Thermoanaerobaculia bacterium]|nr:GWxTD domain-containing protein [Thermoanaerobaculia bacterium]